MTADEIRHAVAVGRQRGLIGSPALQRNGELATSLGGVVSQWMEVTPKMAEEWLTRNLVNRQLNHDAVVCYARQMASGDFIVTHQGIAFNDADELIDGQHKLNAIVMSGVTVRMMVTFGLPRQVAGKHFTTMDVIDTGKPRSVADQLKIQHGVKDATVKARICTALANLCYGQRTRRISLGQTLEVYQTWRAGVDFVSDHRSRQPGLKAVGVLAAFAFAHPVLGQAVEQMFQSLNSGEGLDAHPNLRLLRGFLTSDDARLFTATMDRGLAELVLQALHWENACIEAKAVSDFLAGGQPRAEGAYHFRDAQAARVEKIAALFKLPAKAEPPRPEPPPDAGTPDAAPKAKRPSLEVIVAKAELHFQLARIILLGRGNDADLTSARTVLVAVARGCGYTAEQIAPVLRRTPEQIAALDVGLAALTAKERKAVDTLKRRLGL